MIRAGDVDALAGALATDSTLAVTRVDDGIAVRSTLHLATDWPGRRPNVSTMISMLVDAGCDPNVRCEGPHRETPLHWAASNDDVEAIDALVAAGADIEADGAVIGGLTPIADAAAFGMWAAARRLLDHGAAVNIWQAAALGMVDACAAALPGETPESITNAFWSACHGGQIATAQLLFDHGADPTWVGHDGLTPRNAAERDGHDALVSWLDTVLSDRSS